MVHTTGGVVLDQQRSFNARSYDLVDAPTVASRRETDDAITPIDVRALDNAAIVRITAGDAVALGELYDRHGRAIFGILLRMLGSPEHAEEVTQDVFHSVWRHAASHRQDHGSVRTWLFAISRNAAIDWRRTRGRRFEREARFFEAPPLVADGQVEDEVIARQRGMRVRSAVKVLPPEQQVAVALAFWSGLTQREIAERTGAPLGTVKSRVRLGMAKLRKELEPEFVVPSGA